jgi:uncharacterized Zn finger protein
MNCKKCGTSMEFVDSWELPESSFEMWMYQCPNCKTVQTTREAELYE